MRWRCGGLKAVDAGDSALSVVIDVTLHDEDERNRTPPDSTPQSVVVRGGAVARRMGSNELRNRPATDQIP